MDNRHVEVVGYLHIEGNEKEIVMGKPESIRDQLDAPMKKWREEAIPERSILDKLRQAIKGLFMDSGDWKIGTLIAIPKKTDYEGPK